MCNIYSSVTFMDFYQKVMNTYLEEVSKASYSLERTNKNKTHVNLKAFVDSFSTFSSVLPVT
jgi:hypothetical protein